MITYPKEELARQIDHIIREEGAKPVMEARKIQEEMEAFLAEKLGIMIRPKVREENAKQRRLNEKRKPVGSTIVLPGQGWGYGASSKGMAGYYRDTQTGKIVWTDLPLEYQFSKRADLSTQVWNAVEEQEQMVLDVIQGGRALGRNVKTVCGDLEAFINYPDGGAKVVGRWMGMFPNTEAGRKEAWQREYLAAHGGLQPGSDEAKALLRQPDARDWIEQKMAETTKRGTPRLPSAVKGYAVRLGKAGLDHRAIRIARTETTAMLADEQTAIAENSDIASGEMDFVMDRGRDHWNCNCEQYAEQNPWRVDDPDRPDIPVHPNCMCQWVPHLKTDEEMLKAFKEEMAEDLETIQGTQEQADMLAEIDRAEKAGVELFEPDMVSVAMPGDPNNKTLAIKIERGIVNYSNLTNTEAIHKEAAFINKIGAEKKHEIATLISRNGNNVLGTWEGTESKTNLPGQDYREATKGASPGSVDLLHYHSRGTLFADDDMNTMCRQEKLGRVIVTFPNNDIYALSVGDGHRPAKKDIYNVWDVIYGSLELEEKEISGVNELLPDQKKKIINEVCKRMASMYGWKLEKI
jgi:hypothetical protein